MSRKNKRRAAVAPNQQPAQHPLSQAVHATAAQASPTAIHPTVHAGGPAGVTLPQTGPQLQIAVQQQWSGPLPSPQQLQQFNSIIPKGAERIMTMTEQEAAHRRDQERKALRADFLIQLLGIACAFTVAIGGVAAAVRLALGGHDVVAATMISAPLAIIVTAFLQRRNSNKE